MTESIHESPTPPSGISKRQQFSIATVFLLSFASGIVHYTVGGVAGFLVALVALVGVAWLVGFATEALGEHLNPSATGLVQSTLGNLPEFFIVLFALMNGQAQVAQTSLVGSILANALLVLGLVLVAGATRAEDGVMRFHHRLPQDTATLLMLSVMIIALVGTSAASMDHASHHIQAISVLGSLVLLGVYLSWVIPYVRKAEPQEAGHVMLSRGWCIALLAAAGVMAAFVSDWFVAGIEPVMHQWHLSAAFIGFVVVAVAGNAAENATGIMLAWKGKSDLAVSVVKNSVSQIAAFLFPLLVLVSLLTPVGLTFALAPVYIVALILSALAVWQISGDGKAAQFEGWALVGAFIALAALAWFE